MVGKVVSGIVIVCLELEIGLDWIIGEYVELDFKVRIRFRVWELFLFFFKESGIK